MREIDLLVSHIKTIIVLIEDDFDPEQKDRYFNFTTHVGIFYAFPRKIEDSFNGVIELVKKKARIMQWTISDEQLNKMVIAFLISLFRDYKRNGKVPSDLHKEVRNLLDEIRRVGASNYIILVPLVNIKSEADLLLGGVTFTNLTEEKILQLARQYNLKHIMNKNEDPKSIIERLQSDSRFPSVAIARVNAQDSEKAKQLAIQATEQALNVLRFYAPGTRAMIKGDEFKENSRTLITFDVTNTDNFESMTESCHQVDPDYPDDIVDGETVVKLQRRQLQTINELLNKKVDDLSPLQISILNAIYWIGNAEKDAVAHDKLIKYAIALENMLAQDSREKAETVARRYTAIMCQSWTDAQLIKK